MDHAHSSYRQDRLPTAAAARPADNRDRRWCLAGHTGEAARRMLSAAHGLAQSSGELQRQVEGLLAQMRAA